MKNWGKSNSATMKQKDERSKPSGVLACARDLTEAKHIKKSSKEEDARLKSLVPSSAFIIAAPPDKDTWLWS